MEFAGTEGEAVVEIRSMTLDAIPEHKRHWGRPVEGERPSYHPDLETISGPTLVIEPTRVVRTWTVTRKSTEAQVAAVKAEARRRILSRYPDWKQSNMVARGVELQDVWRTVGSWTASEQAHLLLQQVQEFAHRALLGPQLVQRTRTHRLPPWHVLLLLPWPQL